MSLPFRTSDIDRTIPRPDHIAQIMRARLWRGLDEGFRVERRKARP